MSLPPHMSAPVTDLIQHPWSSYAELEQVYHLIYEHEDDVCSLKEAKNSLIAWALVTSKTAYKPEIRAITAFVNAALHDKQHADDLNLQSLYSTALITFCQVLRNYEFNSGRNKVVRISFIKTGVNRSELAESLGLPGWIVDIRHEAAHGEQVALDLMRRATFLAMDWLSVNFWTIVLGEKRIDRQVDGIVEHVFSDEALVEKKAKADFCGLVNATPHAAIKFMVRSLLKATALSDLTLHGVDSKKAVLFDVIANCGQITLLLHNLIDHFDDDNKEEGAAAFLWFAEVIRGITTKTSPLSPQLSRYSNVETSRIPENEILFMRVLNHLLMTPSENALAYVPCFKKIIPQKGNVIDRLRESLATLLGVGLRGGTVGRDYEVKTIEDVKKAPVNGGLPSSPRKRARRC